MILTGIQPHHTSSISLTIDLLETLRASSRSLDLIQPRILKAVFDRETKAWMDLLDCDHLSPGEPGMARRLPASPGTVLTPWFPNLHLHQDHPEDLLHTRVLDLMPRTAVSGGLWFGGAQNCAVLRSSQGYQGSWCRGHTLRTTVLPHCHISQMH